jgi:nucleoid DNA-binding protein
LSKRKLIERMCRDTPGLSAPEANATIMGVFDALVAVLPEGDVRIPGIGTFKRKLVAQRNARNPRTGEPVVVREHHKIVFKESKPAG